jgi:hypothetical protein
MPVHRPAKRPSIRISSRAAASVMRIAERWLPSPKLRHPYPDWRLDVMTRGRSPVRWQRTPGSCQGRRAIAVPTATPIGLREWHDRISWNALSGRLNADQGHQGGCDPIFPADADRLHIDSGTLSAKRLHLLVQSSSPRTALGSPPPPQVGTRRSGRGARSWRRSRPARPMVRDSVLDECYFRKGSRPAHRGLPIAGPLYGLKRSKCGRMSGSSFPSDVPRPALSGRV